MISVDVRELKNRLSAHLRMVRRGGEILVTDRGETALVGRHLVTDLQFLSLDERVRVNAIELGFDVVPAL